MKNQKGFTVIELLVSFSLTMIIAIFLFEVLIEVKDIFADASTRTAIQEKASIISKNINNILAENDNRISCNNSTNLGNCQINGKNFKIDKESNRVVVDGQNFEMPESVNIKNYSIQDSCDGTNCYLNVTMILDSANLTKDYEYDVTYYFTSNPVELPGPTFKESGTNPKTVTITYPDGCGDIYTCTYKKDNGASVTVNEKTADVVFTNDGDIVATVSDGKNSTSNSYHVEVAQPITLTISTTSTTNSITVTANATSASPITKYEYSVDNGANWVNAGTNNAYTFSNLKQGTTYTVMARVTNRSGAVATANRQMTTAVIPKPTFTEAGNVPKTVTIHYPDGCGSTYTCTYQKDKGTVITVGTSAADITFNESGSLIANVSDGTNTSSNTYNVTVAEDKLSVTLSNTHTTSSITAIANITSVSKVTKYEFSINNGPWQTSGINTYTFNNLKQGTEYTIMTRITNATGKTATATQKVATSVVPTPTFTQSGIYPITVTITYPDGCGSTYTCTYRKDDGTSVNVTTKTVNVSFDYHGDIVANVSDGTNTNSSTYHVQIKLRAIDLKFDKSKTDLDCEDAQCALDAIAAMINKD